MSWSATLPGIWQGRDDSAESPNAKRLFQIVQIQEEKGVPNGAKSGDIGLIGFASDGGVRRNQGRQGAAEGPVALRKALAPLAIHGSTKWWDGGDVSCPGEDLEAAQRQLADLVANYQKSGLRTLVLGGGHETAWPHGLGLYEAHPDKNIGVINFDAHLDMRRAGRATSGTPFLQLAEYCQSTRREFSYLCVGASEASNTVALLDNAYEHGGDIIWDLEFFDISRVIEQIQRFIEPLDAVYLTIDLDCLQASHMFAVSAPAAFGIALKDLMQCVERVGESGKVIGADVVEYNPRFDRDQLCARVAARLVWQMANF